MCKELRHTQKYLIPQHTSLNSNIKKSLRNRIWNTNGISEIRRRRGEEARTGRGLYCWFHQLECAVHKATPHLHDSAVRILRENLTHITATAVFAKHFHKLLWDPPHHHAASWRPWCPSSWVLTCSSRWHWQRVQHGLVLHLVLLWFALNIPHGRWDFPSDPVVKNLPVDAGDVGSIPGPGRCHMLEQAGCSHCWAPVPRPCSTAKRNTVEKSAHCS